MPEYSQETPSRNYSFHSVVLVLDLFCQFFTEDLSASDIGYTDRVPTVLHSKDLRLLYTLSVDWDLWAQVSG